MKQLILVGALITAVAAGVSAQAPTLGTVTLSKKLMADGKPLAPGTYQVRLSTDEVKPPATGQDPNSEKWVEFVKGGKVAGREVATVISAQDVGAIVKGKKPAANGASVEMLKGGDYWRVWINKGGTNYIINLPPGT